MKQRKVPNPDDHFNRGQAYHSIGRDTEARPDFKTSLRLNTNLQKAGYICHLGALLQRLRLYEEAILHYNAAARLSDRKGRSRVDPFELHLNRAHCYECVGNADKAIEDYEKVLEHADPEKQSQAVHYATLGYAWITVTRTDERDEKKCRKALEMMETLCGVHQYDHPRTHLNTLDPHSFKVLAAGHAALEEWEEAKLWIDYSIKLSKEPDPVLRELQKLFKQHDLRWRRQLKQSHWGTEPTTV